MLWVTMEVGTFSSSMYASKNRNHKHILPLGVEANESSQRLNTRFTEGDELFEWSQVLSLDQIITTFPFFNLINTKKKTFLLTTFLPI